MVILLVTIACFLLIALVMAVTRMFRKRSNDGTGSLGGPQPDIQWRLIFKLSLFMCILNGLVSAGIEVIPKLSVNLTTVIVIVMASCPLAIAALVIGKKVPFDRFLHGLLTACVGSFLFPFATLLTLTLTEPLFSLKTSFTDGLVWTAFFIWLFGAITSPLTGLLAIAAGRFFNKNR